MDVSSSTVQLNMEIYSEAGHGFFCDERGSYHEKSA